MGAVAACGEAAERDGELGCGAGDNGTGGGSLLIAAVGDGKDGGGKDLVAFIRYPSCDTVGGQ